jgi:amino acid transporter
MRIAQVSVSFTAVARLPMVAGWDRLLPPWFSQLHSKYRTPVNSILLVGVVAFGIGLVSLIGVGQAEAFQLIWNAGGMFYALTYIVMFAVPIFGLRGVTPRPPLWLKVASWSGLLMTVLYVALSIFPIIQVASVTTFALKISLVILVANAIGIGLYVSARPRASSVAITEA